jgi:hypothetical protein
MNLVLIACAVVLVAAEEKNTRTLLVGTVGGVQVLSGRAASTEAWTTTRVLTVERSAVRALAQDPVSGTVVAGSTRRDEGGSLHVSRDAGRIWSLVEPWPRERQAWAAGFTTKGALMVGSQPADIWHAAKLDGAWSPNSTVQAIPEREKWSFIRAPYEAHFVTLARNPAKPAEWLAAIERGGVLASDDDGATWRLVSPFWDVHVVVFLPDGAWAAAAGEGLKISRDRGATWEDVARPHGYATGLAVDASGRLYAALMGPDEGPLWMSSDSGRTWTPVPGAGKLPHPDYGVHSLTTDPSLPGVLYFGVDDEVWRISDSAARKLADNLGEVLRVLVLH